MAAPSFIDSSYELFSFSGLLNLKCFQNPLQMCYFVPKLELKGIKYILSVNEKLPVSKFRYFGKYIIQLFGYCTFMFLGNDMIV